MFTTSIQVYNTMSFVLVHRSRWHTLCFQVHWSSRVAGPLAAEHPGIHKYMGSRPQLLHSSQPWWGCGPTNGRRCSTRPGSAQSVQPRAGAWTRNPPGCTHGTIYLALGTWTNDQHWRRWCPSWIVWPIQEKWPLLMAKQCFCVRYY